jgi:hypothetical protein
MDENLADRGVSPLGDDSAALGERVERSRRCERLLEDAPGALG